MRSILPLNLMLRSGGHLPYVLSRLETFANPHDAPSDNTNKRVARSTQGQRERRNVLGTLARFAYVRTNPTCVCVYVCVYIRAHPVSLSWGAAFMRYLRVTCLIIGLARCGFGKFRQRRSYTPEERSRSGWGEGNFRSSEGDICSRSLVVEVGFSDVGTFLPFILELNGFSRSS